MPNLSRQCKSLLVRKGTPESCLILREYRPKSGIGGLSAWHWTKVTYLLSNLVPPRALKMQLCHNKTLRGNTSERAMLNDFAFARNSGNKYRTEQREMRLSVLDAWLQLTHLNAFKNISKPFDGLREAGKSAP